MKIKKGFTLVELLLGLAISAIIGVSVYNMFWSAVKLDDKMRRVHDQYMAVLIADQALTHDLENAISLDYSASYPDAVIFDGQKTEFSFLTQTPKGIKHVRYYSGLPGQDPLTKTMIGRVVNESGKNRGTTPVDFLMRQESSMADWLNETANDTTTQVVAAGLQKGSFNCRYVPLVKNLHTVGSDGIVYTDTWDEKGLPSDVSCSFILYDPQKPEAGLMFKRDIFLAPVPDYYHEQ
jgi:prepilin-type N-terminal cleavage/methylation domain-containing protein